jgi:hypothetical protein
MPGGEERMQRRLDRPSAHAEHPAPRAASRVGRLWRTSLAGVLYGSVAGLLLGATFWMLLGLQDLSGASPSWLAPAADPMGVQPSQCTSLTIDRRRGYTTAEPCPGHVLREAAVATGNRRLP